MGEEMAFLLSANAWELLGLLDGASTIGGR